MYAKNLGTTIPTSTLITFYASLLTKSNMAAVGHFGKVFLLFLKPILLMILIHRTLFLCYFHHLGLIFMLTYVPNLIWRPSAILEKSSSLFLALFSRAIPLLLLIWHVEFISNVIFIVGVHFYAYILTNPIWHIGKVIFFDLKPFSRVIPLLLLVLVCRIHF